MLKNKKTSAIKLNGRRRFNIQYSCGIKYTTVFDLSMRHGRMSPVSVPEITYRAGNSPKNIFLFKATMTAAITKKTAGFDAISRSGYLQHSLEIGNAVQEDRRQDTAAVFIPQPVDR